jgi:hypothetical protein
VPTSAPEASEEIAQDFCKTLMAAIATPPHESAIFLLGDGEQRSRTLYGGSDCAQNLTCFGRPVPRNAPHRLRWRANVNRSAVGREAGGRSIRS